MDQSSAQSAKRLSIAHSVAKTTPIHMPSQLMGRRGRATAASTASQRVSLDDLPSSGPRPARPAGAARPIHDNDGRLKDLPMCTGRLSHVLSHEQQGSKSASYLPELKCTLHTDRRYARTNFLAAERSPAKDTGRRQSTNYRDNVGCLSTTYPNLDSRKSERPPVPRGHAATRRVRPVLTHVSSDRTLPILSDPRLG